MQSSLPVSAGDPQGYANCCDALAAADLRAELPRIAAPTLLIAGASDPVTMPADAVAMHDDIRGSVMKTLDASHISNIEAEAAFNAVLKGFLPS
jgi:pimeloyl-ACP methyl ester carboxylesterase